MIPTLRLSPGEAEEVIEDQYRRAKLLRLSQVREQASNFSKNLRRDVSERRQREMKKVEESLGQKIRKELDQIVIDLEGDVLKCLTNFGSAHSKANQENDYTAVQKCVSKKNMEKANFRGKEALRDLHLKRQQNDFVKKRQIIARQQALDTESVRSAFIASLPPVHVEKVKAVEEEYPKVIVFDKCSLFQTESTIKDKLVEPVTSPKDARAAAEKEELELQQLSDAQKLLKQQSAMKVKQRGQKAMNKEQNHINYLRLLEELDKMELAGDDRWELGSNVSSEDQSTGTHTLTFEQHYTHSMHPKPQSLSNSGQNWPTLQPMVADISKLPLGNVKGREEPMPVLTSAPTLPILTQQDSCQLNEIDRLMRELKDERRSWVESDANRTNQATVRTGAEAPTFEPAATAKSREKPNTLKGDQLLSDKVIFDDSDVEIRVRVSEVTDVTAKRRNTESHVDREGHGAEKCRKIAEGVLRKESASMRSRTNDRLTTAGLSQSVADSVPATGATSTPVRPTDMDSKSIALRHYVQKLLRMNRKDVRDLSVGSSFTTFNGSITFETGLKSCMKQVNRTSSSVRSVEEHGSECSPDFGRQLANINSRLSTDARSNHSTSLSVSTFSEGASREVSDSSSLPLGVEAAVYTEKGKQESSSNGRDVLSFKPLLDVYNDVYRAYNLKSSKSDNNPILTLTGNSLPESSFSTLTLSTTSSERSYHANSQLKSSFELTLSSSSCGSSETTPLQSHARVTKNLTRADRMAKMKDDRRAVLTSCQSSNFSLSSSSFESSYTTATQSTASSLSDEISMPDVDEALRRLGLPSMQMVLRR